MTAYGELGFKEIVWVYSELVTDYGELGLKECELIQSSQPTTENRHLKELESIRSSQSTIESRVWNSASPFGACDRLRGVEFERVRVHSELKTDYEKLDFKERAKLVTDYEELGLKEHESIQNLQSTTGSQVLRREHESF